MIVSISGFARVGKDTVTDYLIYKKGFVRKRLADGVRDSLYILNPIVSAEQHIRVADVIDMFGWDGVKASVYADEMRRLMQVMGTEVARNRWGDNFWVDIAFSQMTDADKNYVIPDVRFKNEFDAVKQHGGVTIRVERPGIGPTNNHPSETESVGLDYDFVISNDGTIADLHESVDSIIENYLSV